MTAADELDERFVTAVRALPEHAPPELPVDRRVDHDLLVRYFDAQVQSRHLDFAARTLQGRGEGFYTIASAGHESNAALGLCTRVTDPALLHYRSGGFYAGRASLVEGSTPIRDVLAGCAASTLDPISAGRHKVFGNADLNILPQTSTIASHLPRAVGLALALPRMQRLGLAAAWPWDSVVVCSFGDASANHSTAVGALNAAAYCRHRGLSLPLLLVCEDNGLGISVPTPPGWLERSLSSYPGIEYRSVDGADPVEMLTAATDAAETVRTTRAPILLHVRAVRFLGHAGSDVESAYRSPSDLAADHERDPLVGTARELAARGVLDAAGILDRYERIRAEVDSVADSLTRPPRLATTAEVMRPLESGLVLVDDDPHPAGEPLTLAGAVTRALGQLLEEDPHTCVFGEDVGLKGGVYGVTRGLQERFGRLRVFDTLLDEQTILGTALGFAVAGMLPIPEIQYLAYLHNAEDQLRGEAASLAFFSDGRYRNPMVVRIAGLPYQRGFGGHFHNDDSVAVLRDIPGLVLAVPSSPATAGALLRTCVELARQEGRVCVYLEPIALYHRRDLYDEGDGLWQQVPDTAGLPPGSVCTYGDGRDVLVVTFGNGVPMSLRAVRRAGVAATVLDLQWLSPLPTTALLEHVRRFERVVVVDETRRSGGVAEAVVAALVDEAWQGRITRVTSHDSYVPLGPAAAHVLMSEDDIVRALLEA
ncbi:thiamine pyrophosphate-dependent enzyme [Rhodococcus rhodochrous]|uniref:thiamine pyrophosphate-dependent enzyme n=1 Tax=Rhodococcus rhodochrous TaxID=1829 RepID=UPI00132ED403|nr:thiamine pyrophosphate-dependent enzyme [Rhodococcus rhodochrous]QHG82144.1 MFS transporter [Rhodococcus rhodochrous]QOH58182.1 MFS transporter [Rhodococcus rhodochrous]